MYKLSHLQHLDCSQKIILELLCIIQALFCSLWCWKTLEQSPTLGEGRPHVEEKGGMRKKEVWCCCVFIVIFTWLVYNYESDFQLVIIRCWTQLQSYIDGLGSEMKKLAKLDPCKILLLTYSDFYPCRNMYFSMYSIHYSKLLTERKIQPCSVCSSQ